MSNAKHTPGPWGYSQWPDQSIFNIHAGGFAEAFAVVKNVENAHRGMGSVETRANARLIAAAPELLAALEAMLNYANLGAYERADAVKAARAAIAKAKGEERMTTITLRTEKGE